MKQKNNQLKRIEKTLREGTYTNEDLLSIQDGSAWVLDGTSGFSERSLTDHPESDGVWFVETANKYLKKEMDTETALPEIIATVIERVVIDLYDEVGIEPTLEYDHETPKVSDAVNMHELPGATIGLVRWDESTLEYYSLGDSSILITTDETTEHHIEGGPQVFDAELRGRVGEYLQENPEATSDDVRSMALPLIRENRQYREIPGGFWCLGINPISATQAVVGQCPIDTVDHVSLFTDGLLDLVEIFGVFDEWEDVASYIDDRGTDAIVERVREAERDDLSMLQYPRLKPMDDVAVINLEF